MAKKRKAKPAPKAAADDLQFRSWCIEQAIRWPVHHESGYGANIGGYGGSRPEIHRDEDVIGRANKIRDWVLG